MKFCLENCKHVTWFMSCNDIAECMDQFLFGRAAVCYDQGIEHVPYTATKNILSYRKSCYRWDKRSQNSGGWLIASSTYYKAPKTNAWSAAPFQYTKNNDWIMELGRSDTDYEGGLGDPRSYRRFPRKPGWIFHFSGNSKNETKKTLCCLALLGFFFIPGQHKVFFGFGPT